jgi:hypothetical protein
MNGDDKPLPPVDDLLTWGNLIGNAHGDERLQVLQAYKLACQRDAEGELGE